MNLDRNRVEQLLNQFTGKTVLIVGDLMLDEFIWGKVGRISPEAPVPVVEVLEETYRLGGSGNVAANIQALGGNPILVGILGKDSASERVIELLRQAGVEVSGILRDDRPTTVKTRIIAHSQQVVRTDRESRTALSHELNASLAASLLSFLPEASAIVVSDYDKGVVNRELLSTILPKSRSVGVPVFLDPKVHHADYYRPITAITPNQREAELLAGMPIEDVSSLEEAGHRILRKFQCEYALITRGEEGMSLFNASSAVHLPTFAREVFDVTGAGDTVIAALAMSCAGGATIEESSVLANHAAGIVVGKVGTATASRSELLSDFQARNAHSAG